MDPTDIALVKATATLTLALAAIACRSPAGSAPVHRAVDVDGDGRADRFEVVAADGTVIRATPAPASGSDPERTLVLAIDGIPHEMFARLQEEGLFGGFFPAAEMVAPFPSLTDVSFTALFRTAPSAAYEDRYYDRAENRMGGGIEDRVSGEYRDLAPFHAVFDWEEPRLWGGFVYLVPERVALAELAKAEEVLRESEDPELVVYLGSTDGLGHEEGWRGLEAHLRRVDRVLLRFLAEGGGSRRVVLLSDHGMSRGGTRRLDLERALARAGFRIGERIDGPDDVVAPAYGLIGSVQIYTMCGREEDVARAVATEEGVDFAAWREGGGFAAVDARGRTDLADRAGSDYPNLLERVAEGVRNHTTHPASVFLSLEDGWHWGLRLFEPFVSLEGTHGSARYEQSVGFVASNVDRLPARLAAEEIYPWLGLSHPPAPEADFVDPCPDGR